MALDTVPAALRLLGQQREKDREGDAPTLCIFPSMGMWSYGIGSSPGSTTHGWGAGENDGGGGETAPQPLPSPSLNPLPPTSKTTYPTFSFSQRTKAFVQTDSETGPQEVTTYHTWNASVSSSV